MTIISDISCPVTVTRLIAESPPTFTVWQPGGPDAGGNGVDDVVGRGSSSTPDVSVEVGVGFGEGVNSGVGEEVEVDVGEGEAVSVGAGVVVSVGAGEDVGVGESVGEGEGERVGSGEVVGKGVSVGAGVRVGSGVNVESGVSVGSGEGEAVSVGEGDDVGVRAGDVVGTVVTGGATTMINSERLSVLSMVMFRTVRFTVYIPGVSYTCSGFFKEVMLVLNHDPSPNDQFHTDGNPPAEVSENRTVKGAVPFRDDAVKSRNNGEIPIAYLRSLFPKSR